MTGGRSLTMGRVVTESQTFDLSISTLRYMQTLCLGNFMYRGHHGGTMSMSVC